MTVHSAQPRPARRPTWRAALRSAAVGAATLALGLFAAPAAGQSMKPAGDGVPIQGAGGDRLKAFKDVGIKQNRDAQIPPATAFKDDQGRDVTLADYFKGGRFNAAGRPVLFTLVYFGCPSLCTMVLNEMNKSLTAMPPGFDPGKQFEIVVISFDPTEGPQLAYDKKMSYAKQLRRADAEAGYHFLTGKPEAIKAVCDAVGFTYAWDEPHKQFIHAGGIMVLTPAGRVSKYFYGVEYVPRDIRLALVEAADGKIGSVSEQIMLFCFQYDPHTGRYTVYITRLVQVFGGALVLGLGAFMFHSYRKGRRVALPAGATAAADGDTAEGDAVEPTDRDRLNKDRGPADDAAATKDAKDNG